MSRKLLWLWAAAAFAQGQQHAAWTLAVEPAAAAPGRTVRVRAAAQIDAGWHLYAPSSAAGIPAGFQVSPEKLVRVLQPAPQRAFDPVLNAQADTYEGSAAFLLDVTLRDNAPAGPEDLAVSIRYQTCNSTTCVPGKWTGTVPLKVDASAPAAASAIPAGYAEPKAPAAQGESQGWAAFLLVAFGFGLACIFTPCVFPMIPITMSYFLNRQSGGRREGVVQAVVFCLGIVVLFSGLGLLATAVLGPVGVRQLGSSPWVSGFIAALFIAFGLSLLGAFEITIPSSILTKLNESSGKGGFAGTLLMGLTFSLSSFACVGPFVGTLLAASVGGGWTRPIFGMVTFATGLALPFFLLALFPSYLKRLPRSGGWLARVKVVMGFVILAFSLKYLANLDQVMQWGFLTRERFLAGWIVLFGMAGLYLLGFVRLEGIKPDENMGLGRLLVGIGFLMFALSLVPGMTGGKLGSLDAYIPAGDTGSSSAPADGLVWMKDQYREALDRARGEHKLVFIDFTGYACANCHWMRANILSRPEVAAALKDFILLELYTDGTDAASEANSKLQLAKFGTVAEPLYAILDPDEKLVARFDGLTHDPAEFLAFLRKASAPAPPAQPAAGTDYPQLSRLEGGPLDTSAWSGKVVVVNYWATWCVPCVGELPTFNKLSKEFAAKGVMVVGVDTDEEGAEKVRPFLQKHPIDYSLAHGPAMDELPVTVVYNRAGKEAKRFQGSITEDELLAAVQKAL